MRLIIKKNRYVCFSFKKFCISLNTKWYGFQYEKNEEMIYIDIGFITGSINR